MTETRDTYLLLRAFADELARCEIAGACTSPGSRSTPLVLSLVREQRIPCFSHVDERCAGFFALGLAKASGRPAAVACTSGTAAANYLPAVIEAREARVPLIVLTADRPPELRDVGAGQAIDQLKLFGSAVKWFFEVGSHTATAQRLAWMRQLACRAVWTALEGRPGPVHLNFPLREPLVLDEELPADATGRRDGRPFVTPLPAPPAPADALAQLARGATRPVVVAGRLERSGNRLGEAVQALGVPLLADPLSGLRTGPAAIAHYDALLRAEEFAAAQRPDLVVRIGDIPTSKPLRAWLASLDAEQVAVDAESAWQDPDAAVSRRLAADPGDALAAVAGAKSDAAWLCAWRTADERAKQAIAGELGDALSEPLVAGDLATLVPGHGAVVVASSMPVRDVEAFWPVLDGAPRVLANRGANGIDGTVSTAYGVAATGVPTALLIGDVALAHDVGGLLAASRLGLPLTIVLLDNRGGGIFDFLPVSTQTDAYEEHVATPTGLDAERIAALFGLAYAKPGDRSGFAAAVRDGLAERGTTLVHIETDRAENVALHRRLGEAVASIVRTLQG